MQVLEVVEPSLHFCHLVCIVHIVPFHSYWIDSTGCHAKHTRGDCLGFSQRDLKDFRLKHSGSRLYLMLWMHSHHAFVHGNREVIIAVGVIGLVSVKGIEFFRFHLRFIV